MQSMGPIVVMVVIVGWLIVLLLGSIVALRAIRSWATVLLTIGTALMMVGAIGYFVAAFYMISRVRTGTGMYGTSGVEFWTIMFGVTAIMFGLGVLLFTGGFLGVCTRYGATIRRATELEGLVTQLQQRIQSGL